MARPRIKNLDQNIIHEVMALSYESGLSVLSTKKIASRLKVSEPTIFAHFGTKAKLLLAAFAEAWSLAPIDFIMPDENGDEESFRVFREHCIGAAENPLACRYVANFMKSDYYRRHKDEAKEIMKVLWNKVGDVIRKIHPAIDQERLEILTEIFVESAVANHNSVCDLNLAHEGRYLRTLYDYRYYGLTYLLNKSE